MLAGSRDASFVDGQGAVANFFFSTERQWMAAGMSMSRIMAIIESERLRQMEK
jgi:hypothetical protein